MPRDPESSLLREVLRASGDSAPSLNDKVRFVREVRAQSEAHADRVDRFMIEDITGLYGGLKEAEASQQQLRNLLEKLGAVPWHPATYMQPVLTTEGPRIVVMHGNSRRLVGLADGVEVDSLTKGDDVFLGNELNVVMSKSPYGVAPYGEIATFQRRLPDGRVVLQRRGDEEVVVDVGGAVEELELKTGDLIRWDRNCFLALEKMPPAEGNQFLLSEVGQVERDQVGGQHQNLEMLLALLTMTLVAPEKAVLYGLNNGRQTIIMVGPPGCGKTLMARVAAAEITRRSGERCRVAVVKPGEWEDPFIGVTQQKIRNCFEAIARASANGKVLLFIDEIETIGRIRGGLAAQHADKFLGALLAEIDGFADRSNVAIITATNRKDLVDPALLERLSDVEISVGRPDMAGAREIFGIHLPQTIPYSSNGTTSGETRQQIIDTAVARFYSPNADNELCQLRFRDGKTRTIVARELASGRCFEQVCRAARVQAFYRDASGGEAGLRLTDMESALSDTMEKLASTLTRANVHAYISDLPQDVDVVSVEPIIRKVKRAYQYLNLNVA